MTMALFQYSSLLNDRTSVRLLKLYPDDDSGSKITCELFHSDTNSNIQYEALSYTWGDDPHTVDIQVNGCDFPVKLNLEAALRALRKIDDPRVLWIDAICINQADLKERAKHVRNMWSIYQAASCVLVWLGLGDGDSDIAMDNFGRRAAQTSLAAREFQVHNPKERPADYEGRWCGCPAGNWSTYPPRIGLLNIAMRRWFTRVWVFPQEPVKKTQQMDAYISRSSKKSLLRNVW